MSQLFLSHSSKDNFAALALSDWLVSEGWDDLFLDLDPERGIVAGERWERALHQAAHRCDAVLFLVSSNWLASEWCLREFDLAHRLNKRIFGVLIEGLPVEDLPDKLTATWQLVNLAGGTDHEVLRAAHPDTGEERHVNFSATGLKRLRAGLMRAGLDPRFFEWPPADDPDRAPYRGMRALEAEDAGIFFGREAPIIELLAELRGLRDDPPPRLLVILGASGAGKSSFVRAGLLPRLGRDDRHFAVLPVIRPGHDVLTGDDGLIAALDTACRKASVAINRATLRRHVLEAEPDNPQALAETLRELSQAQRAAPLPGESDEGAPTLVMPIDQAEELFVAEGAEAANRFLHLIRALADNQEVPLMVVLTIRSDSYEQLQTTAALEGIRPRLYPLAPMPQGNYQMVIEGPAKRLVEAGGKLTIEPQLTDRLLEDIQRDGSKDALPLLAFTLERLYRDYGGDGDLRQDEYEDMRGINGAIDAAVEQALTAGIKDECLPTDRDALMTLLRRGLIPWLAGIDPDTQAPRRRIARASEIPEEARPIIEHLIAQRLLATDVNDDGETTIEPAHEALLRQWGRLKDWLEEDFAALTTLEALQRATRDWEANDRDEKYLVHHAGRLEDAEGLTERPDLDEAMTRSDRAYLNACRKREDDQRDRELKRAKELAEAQKREAEAQRREAEAQKIKADAQQVAAQEREKALEQQKRVSQRTRLGLMVALVLATAAGVIGWQAYRQAAIAATERDRAEHQTEIAEDSLREANHNFGLALIGKAEARAAEAGHQEALYYRLHAHSKLQDDARPDNIRGIFSELDQTPLPVWSSKTSSHHKDAVNSVAFSPDGIRLASGADDNTIKIWDVASGELLITLDGHSDSVRSIAFSPDGARLASGSSDNTIKFWDLASGDLLRTLDGHSDGVLSVAFSPDGARLASGSRDNSIKLWDATSGDPLRTFDGHTDWVFSIAFSPDGRRLVSSSETIMLWDVDSGELLTTLEGHSDWILSIAFSPDGLRLASGSTDNTIKLWDVLSGELLTTVETHLHGVNSVVFSPDGTRLASASWDGTVKLWDIVNDVALSTLKGHSKGILSVAFSMDGTRLASGSNDNTVMLWDVAQTALLSTLEGHSDSVLSVAFSPRGARLASGSADNAIKLWDLETSALVSTLGWHSDQVNSVAFSPDGARLASGSMDGTIKLWSVPSGALLDTISVDQTLYSSSVESVAFSPAGTELVSVAGFTIKLWDVETGTLQSTLEGHSSQVRSVAFSPNGTRLASGSSDGTIQLWDADTGELLSTQKGHSDRVTNIDFTPDGTRLASGSTDGTIKLWDVNAASFLTTLAVHSSGVRSLSFSSDGPWLASGSVAESIKLWDVTTGEFLTTLEGHASAIDSITFSPDGTRLASGSADERYIPSQGFTNGFATVKVWDTSRLNESKDGFNQVLDQQVIVTGMRLDGLDLSYGTSLTQTMVESVRNVFGNEPENIRPFWRETDPFFWLPEATAGDIDAMIRVGNAFFRRKQHDQARHWFEQALAQGDERAEERLELLDRTSANLE